MSLTWQRATACILGLLLAFGGGGAANATTVVDLLFTSRNGASIAPTASVAAQPGDRLGASLRVTADAGGVSSYSLSARFDGDLNDELDLVSATEVVSVAFEIDLSEGPVSTQESSPTLAGEIFSLAALSVGPGVVDAPFEIAILEFLVTGNVASDGVDVVTGLFNAPVDGLFDSMGANIASGAVFRGGTVNVPEPATGLLVMAGVLGLAGWGRRRLH